MRTLESALVGLALALVVAGVVLGALVTPPFTRTLVRGLDVAATSGVSPAAVESLAERVRVFVTDRSSPGLPADFEGAPAFDEAAVSHLEDVREVLFAARATTGVLAGVLAIWLAFGLARKRTDRIASALFAGALWCLVIPVVGAVLALSDFDSFFAGFHALFFESGTWTFPADALLIRLFPEPFWEGAGAALAAGIVFGGAMLGALGYLVRRGTRVTSGGARQPTA